MSNKLENIYDEIKKDLVIDKTDLGHEAIKSSTLFIKYIRMFTDEDLKLRSLYVRKNKMIAEKRDYYTGNAPADVYAKKPFGLKLKTEAVIQKYIDADDDIVVLNNKIAAQTCIVELLKNVMDEIKRRGYAIKAAIDYHRFENGG